MSLSILPRKTLADNVVRPKDVGNSKAIVAAEFIMNRVPGVKVTPYVFPQYSQNVFHNYDVGTSERSKTKTNPTTCNST